MVIYFNVDIIESENKRIVLLLRDSREIIFGELGGCFVFGGGVAAIKYHIKGSVMINHIVILTLGCH